MTRVIIGLILAVLFFLFIKEWRKKSSVMEKEEELSAVNEQDHVLDLDEEIVIKKSDQKKRLMEIGILNSETEVEKNDEQ